MVVIDHLDKARKVGTLSNPLLAHRFLHSARILFNARNNAMAVSMLVCAAIVRLKDNGLLARVLALQHNDNFP